MTDHLFEQRVSQLEREIVQLKLRTKFCGDKSSWGNELAGTALANICLNGTSI